MLRPTSAFLIAIALCIAWPGDTVSYPNGPLDQVANGGPYCASCHSSLQKETIRDLPEKKAAEILAPEKHYRAIELGLNEYKALAPEVRKTLLKDVRAVDENTRVTIEAPEKVAPGETFKVTVRTRGGSGPVIGVMLLDSNLRYQSSPPQTVGWGIAAPPEVLGPDGGKQTKWIDKRHRDVTKNINFVLVFGVESDPRKGVYPETKVVYTVRAPETKGPLPLSAAMLHGTEKSSPVGYKEEIWGKVPVGGFTAPSGRVLFTEVRTIDVR